MKMMNFVLSSTLSIATVSSTLPASAFAQNTNSTSTSKADPKEAIDEVHVSAALRLLKAVHAGKSNLDGLDSQVVMKLGAGLAGAGVVTLAIHYAGVAFDLSSIADGDIFALCGAVGVLETVAGGTLFVMASLAALYETVVPQSAQAEGIDGYFLYSSENYANFLKLPIESQKSILRYSAKMRVATVALAGGIATQLLQK